MAAGVLGIDGIARMWMRERRTGTEAETRTRTRTGTETGTSVGGLGRAGTGTRGAGALHARADSDGGDSDPEATMLADTEVRSYGAAGIAEPGISGSEGGCRWRSSCFEKSCVPSRLLEGELAACVGELDASVRANRRQGTVDSDWVVLGARDHVGVTSGSEFGLGYGLADVDVGLESGGG